MGRRLSQINSDLFFLITIFFNLCISALICVLMFLLSGIPNSYLAVFEQYDIYLTP